jgi:hypothetical protein
MHPSLLIPEICGCLLAIIPDEEAYLPLPSAVLQKQSACNDGLI